MPKRQNKAPPKKANAGWTYSPRRDLEKTHDLYQDEVHSVNEAINAVDRKWGRGRLPLIVSYETRERFCLQFELHREACWSGSMEDVAKQSAGMRRAMRTYCAKSNKKVDDEKRLVREIVRHYILVAANSGLRVGEQRQLRWCDVQIERKTTNGELRVLANINVRAETSKVRTSRTFYCRGGEHFARLKELLRPQHQDDLIFSIDGDEPLSKRAVLYHFHKIIALADITDSETRDLVPYS